MRPRLPCAAVAALVLAALLAGCAKVAKEPVPPKVAAPPEFPATYYRQALEQGKRVLRIDPRDSLVVVEVRRSGKLARMGHDHVVASHHVTGYVAPEAGRADLYIQLERLAVDEASLRTEAGFDTQPSEADIEGTRTNMLEKVLEASKFPFALVRVTRPPSKQENAQLDVALTLHGETRTLKAPAQVKPVDDGLLVTGRLSFNQTDFGIKPYTVLGGALAVQNKLDLRYRIHARRATAVE